MRTYHDNGQSANRLQVRETTFIVFAAAPQTAAADELRLAALYAAQSKLHVGRALIALPDDQLHLRDAFKSLARWLQLVIEAMQKFPVSG